MSLTFYAGSGSPFSWRVWLALEHKRVPYSLNMLSFSEGDLQRPGFLALNPRGKVPTLVDGDFVLFESAAIVEYLDEAYPGTPLFPGDAKQRATVRRLVQEVDNYLDQAVESVLGELLWKQGLPDQVKVDAGCAAIRKELAYFERCLSQDFLAGPLSAADFALYSILALALRVEQTRHPDLGVGAAMGPRLKAWKARIEALPYFAATYPPHWREA